jgi:hypothetical protein
MTMADACRHVPEPTLPFCAIGFSWHRNRTVMVNNSSGSNSHSRFQFLLD